MQVATAPHGAIAANKLLPGKKTMSMQAVSVPTSPAPRSLGSLGLMGVMAVVWLAVAAFAVVMLAVKLVVDAGAFLLGGGRPGPARTSARRAALIPTIF